MALLDGLSMSFTSDKRCFIQLPDFYVFRCGFLLGILGEYSVLILNFIPVY